MLRLPHPSSVIFTQKWEQSFFSQIYDWNGSLLNLLDKYHSIKVVVIFVITKPRNCQSRRPRNSQKMVMSIAISCIDRGLYYNILKVMDVSRIELFNQTVQGSVSHFYTLNTACTHYLLVLQRWANLGQAFRNNICNKYACDLNN